MKALKIGNLTIPIPIIQGGMGVCVSLSGLAAAVANEGGVGVISAVGIGMTEPGYRKNFKKANIVALRKEIRKARAATDGVIGVNIMLAVSDFDDLLHVALEEHVDVLFLGAGLPLKIFSNMDEAFINQITTKFIPKVSSARAAKIIFNHWSEKYHRVPDAVVIEGPLAGGHLGFKKPNLVSGEDSLIDIIKEVRPVIQRFEMQYGIEIPIIAGGGIYTGSEMYDVINAGASAVKMGTRFVTTNECDVSIKFKENYLRCKKEDIVIIDSPVGLPARVIKNSFVQEILNGKKSPVNCPWKCLKTCDYTKVQFCVAEALFNAAQGDFENGFSFAGTEAYRAEKIISVKETVNLLIEEYCEREVQMTRAMAVGF